MNRIAIGAACAILAASLSGCATMTPKQREVAEVAASFIVVGAIAAHQHHSAKSLGFIGPLPPKNCPSGGKDGPIYYC